jgi:preprotein translocase SecE subunit
MKSIWLFQFLGEVKSELSRVEWPTFQEFVGSTVVTLFLIFLFAVFFGFVDRSVAFGAKQILSYSVELF